jgi:hypothetical protein
MPGVRSSEKSAYPMPSCLRFATGRANSCDSRIDRADCADLAKVSGEWTSFLSSTPQMSDVGFKVNIFLEFVSDN